MDCASKTILVISPHIDDAEIGVGGLMARFASEGHSVTIGLLSASNYVSSTGEPVLASERLAEQARSTRILGVSFRFLNVAKENEFPQASYPLMVARIDQLLDDLKPDLLFLPMPVGNQDHVTAHAVCMASLRSMRSVRIGEIHVYETPGCQLGYAATAPVYWPLRLEDVDKKWRAINVFQSQQGAARAMMEQCEALWKWRGAECGHECAEKTYLLQAVRPS